MTNLNSNIEDLNTAEDFIINVLSFFFLSMCDVKIFLTFTSPNMVLL